EYLEIRTARAARAGAGRAHRPPARSSQGQDRGGGLLYPRGLAAVGLQDGRLPAPQAPTAHRQPRRSALPHHPPRPRRRAGAARPAL
ncbi:MAG: hypothetical protein AVDCRST_MAG23-1995, partial [uncultured Sphingosinicella sp.]